MPRPRLRDTRQARHDGPPVVGPSRTPNLHQSCPGGHTRCGYRHGLSGRRTLRWALCEIFQHREARGDVVTVCCGKAVLTTETPLQLSRQSNADRGWSYQSIRRCSNLSIDKKTMRGSWVCSRSKRVKKSQIGSGPGDGSVCRCQRSYLIVTLEFLPRVAPCTTFCVAVTCILQSTYNQHTPRHNHIHRHVFDAKCSTAPLASRERSAEGAREARSPRETQGMMPIQCDHCVPLVSAF